MVLSMACNWVIATLDVSTAFLHAPLNYAENLYVIPPAPYDCNGTVWWKLKKALYGLRGAPRAWQDYLISLLEELGFFRLLSEACLSSRGVELDGIGSR